jgi:hypothetical protein
MRELLSESRAAPSARTWRAFFRGCRAQPRMVHERSLATDLDDDGCPGLATLVAAVSRSGGGSSRAGEVSLALGG